MKPIAPQSCSSQAMRRTSTGRWPPPREPAPWAGSAGRRSSGNPPPSRLPNGCAIGKPPPRCFLGRLSRPGRSAPLSPQEVGGAAPRARAAKPGGTARAGLSSREGWESVVCGGRPGVTCRGIGGDRGPLARRVMAMAEEQAVAQRVAVRLPDGAVREYPRGTTVAEVAKDLGGRIAREALVARVNGRLVDLSCRLKSDAELELLTAESEEGLEVLRHSTAHVMAQAVKRLIPEAKLAIGPPIENGFYYDFDLPRPLTPDDLKQIEEEMRRIIKEDYPFSRDEMDREAAIRFYKERGEEYKVEILEELDDPRPSFYQQGEF